MKKISIAVFIDAFGWEILKKHSFLDDVLTYRQPLKSMLGYSSTCVPTILTGQYPQKHGHMSFFFYSPKTSPFRHLRFLRWLPKSITSRGRVRHLISKLIKKVHGYTGYFQIYNIPFEHIHLFDYSEKNDIYEPGGINGGCGTVFDRLREAGAPFHKSDWRQNETKNFEAARAELAKGDIRFAYLYWAEMDGLLHEETKNGAHIAEKIRWYETRLREVLETARQKYDDVQLTVVSDHGMCTVTEPMDLMKAVDGAGLRFGEDYAAVYDSTMARFWFLKPGSREKIEAVLRAEKRGRILTEAELEGYGCSFENAKYGELFFLVNPGMLICPSHMGEDFVGGMHGYEPGQPDSMAVFASNTAPPAPLRDLTDIYPVLLQSCGVNGSAARGTRS